MNNSKKRCTTFWYTLDSSAIYLNRCFDDASSFRNDKQFPRSSKCHIKVACACGCFYLCWFWSTNQVVGNIKPNKLFDDVITCRCFHRTHKNSKTWNNSYLKWLIIQRNNFTKWSIWDDKCSVVIRADPIKTKALKFSGCDSRNVSDDLNEWKERRENIL